MHPSRIRGWFDQRVFLLMVEDWPADFSFYDANALIVPSAYGAGRDAVHYFQRLVSEGRVFGEQSAFTFHHEYVHYIQAMRSLANIWLTGSTVAALQWAPDLRSSLAEADGWPATDSEVYVPEGESLIALNTWRWFNEGDRLTVRNIQESEAELLAQFSGIGSFRFRNYASGVRNSTVTAHFDYLKSRKRGYAEAYLRVEAVLGPLAAAVFPLLSYFAQSMPAERSDSGEYLLVPAEEAFQAALDHLEADADLLASYYHYAYDLHRVEGFALDPARDLVHEFGRKVCESRGWIYNGPELRRRWAKNLAKLGGPFPRKMGGSFTSKIAQVLLKALDLEARYGPMLFIEVWSPPCTKILLKKLPLPAVVVPQDTEDPFVVGVLSSGYWGSEFVHAALLVRALAGATFGILFNGNMGRPPCPHASECPHASARLCNDHFPYPQSWQVCPFPATFAGWFGVELTSFHRQR
jgi:hypothetical protein